MTRFRWAMLLAITGALVVGGVAVADERAAALQAAQAEYGRLAEIQANREGTISELKASLEALKGELDSQKDETVKLRAENAALGEVNTKIKADLEQVQATAETEKEARRAAEGLVDRGYPAQRDEQALPGSEGVRCECVGAADEIDQRPVRVAGAGVQEARSHP